ncbi:hypothetical protein CDD83_9044 [Cordyceps sp. RAO-2017]|nr:hypothetical protein CDD83_9044 [Cordyceps sp. RAO-2017]
MHVFAGADAAAPSHNPSCLKWQTYLRIAGVDVDVVPSTNHASPSGALPFLLPASSDARPDVPLTGSKIARYAHDHGARTDADDDLASPSPRREAYLALLTQSVRPAWLYALYLDPANGPLLADLYFSPSSSAASSSLLLRAANQRALRAAATAEILKTTRRPLLDPPALAAEAEAAFRALSALLADDDWFFGARAPGLFDAAVFAYTHPILDDGLAWADDGLGARLARFANLVAHRTALYERCWGREAENP